MHHITTLGSCNIEKREAIIEEGRMTLNNGVRAYVCVLIIEMKK